MADELDKWIKHEKRLSEIEPKVESLWYHYRQDRVLERLTEFGERARQALATAERAEQGINKIVDRAETAAARAEVAAKKSNGGNDAETRLRWVERMMWGAIGAVAMFELMVRVWKTGG